MKRTTISIFFSLLAIAVIAGSTLAQSTPLPGSGWWFGEQIQNVGHTQTTINSNTYDFAPPASYNITGPPLNAGDSITYQTTDIGGMPYNFQGSTVVSSNQEIRVVVNHTNRSPYSPWTGLGDPYSISPAAGQYTGMNSPATTLRFPLVKNDYYGKTTTFFVQNVGTAAAIATATFIFPTGTYYYTTPSIGLDRMAVIEPVDARDSNGKHPPISDTSSIGSLTVASVQTLAGVVMEHSTMEDHATVLQTTRAFTSNDYNSKVYAPVNKNNFYDRFTGLQVQNVSGHMINITVTYNGSSGGCVGQVFTDNATNLAIGASWNFPSSVLPSGCFAAATVLATGNIVSTVSEAFTSVYMNAHPGHAQEATTYSAIPDSAVTTVISAPLFKEDSYSKATGLTVQNVGSSQAHVTAIFKNNMGTFVTNPMTIDINQNIVLMDMRLLSSSQNPPSWWHGWNGAAMTPAALGCGVISPTCGANGIFSVILTSDQNIAAIANETTYPVTNPPFYQDKSNYEGINLTSAP